MLPLQKAFRRKTGSENNRITFKEFCAGLRVMNVKMSASKMHRLFVSLDRTGDGSIDYDEFLDGILKQPNAGRRTHH